MRYRVTRLGPVRRTATTVAGWVRTPSERFCSADQRRLWKLGGLSGGSDQLAALRAASELRAQQLQHSLEYFGSPWIGQANAAGNRDSALKRIARI